MARKREQAVPATPPDRTWARAAAWLAVATIAWLWMFFRLINRNAVDMLYYDEWDYFGPLFDGRGVFSMFTLQHGPPRLGLGGVLIGIIANASAWSTRAIAFTTGFTIALAFVVALVVKARLGNPLSPADALLPILFFNLAQYESLVVVANPAHGAVPLLLAMLFVYAWTLRHRYVFVSVINFFLVFTGFGFFFAIITPVLLAFDFYRSRRRQAIIAFVMSIVTIVLFFIGWKFQPAIDCFQFPHPRPLEYIGFIALMFSRFLGVTSAVGFGVALGTVVLGLLIWVVIRHARHLDEPRSVAIAVLGAFTLLFCANAAVGRVCAGITGGQASRYATLLIPGFFALYLHATAYSGLLRARVLSVFATLVVTLALMNSGYELAAANSYGTGKRTWRDCYRATHDITACDAATHFSVYPTPVFAPKLQFLERHHLNGF